MLTKVLPPGKDWSYALKLLLIHYLDSQRRWRCRRRQWRRQRWRTGGTLEKDSNCFGMILQRDQLRKKFFGGTEKFGPNYFSENLFFQLWPEYFFLLTPRGTRAIKFSPSTKFFSTPTSLFLPLLSLPLLSLFKHFFSGTFSFFSPSFVCFSISAQN